MIELKQATIADYGIIGDCKCAALVSKSGAVDWLCWPNFDSPPVFSRLLDPNAGSTWSIAPAAAFTSERRYVGKTNVLETVFQTASGAVSVTDFMPVAEEEFQRSNLQPERQVTRQITCLSGSVEMQVLFRPGDGFKNRKPSLVDKGRMGLRAELAHGEMLMYCDLAWTLAPGEAVAQFVVNAGEEQVFNLTFSTEAPAVFPAGGELDRTLAWWQRWSSKFSYTGPYAEDVQRSILTLKLLQFAPTGAFIAAPTTSLPESEGADLNWDYRFCWLRDASFNLHAFCGTGYGEEADAFLEWALHATRLTQPKLMVAYDLFGNPVPKEQEIREFAGYKESRPVRVGNMAGEQHQLDTYGEVICGSSQVLRSRKFADRETQAVLTRFGDFVMKHWKDPDAGIWESRDTPSIHTHSRLLCWVALDELLGLHQAGILPKLKAEALSKTREEIRASVEQTCWDATVHSYVSTPGKEAMDASLLLLGLHQFDQPDSERMQQTWRRITTELGAGRGLLLRNRTDPGKPVEGAFGICSFWAAEFLAMGGGTLEEAQAQFEAALRYGNDLGLFSEEADMTTGAALGNFPQSFTHLGLINAALAIEKRQRSLQEEAAA